MSSSRAWQDNSLDWPPSWPLSWLCPAVCGPLAASTSRLMLLRRRFRWCPASMQARDGPCTAGEHQDQLPAGFEVDACAGPSSADLGLSPHNKYAPVIWSSCIKGNF